MLQTSGKTISVEVSKECWKKLKTIALNKDLSLSMYVREVLEKVAMKKNAVEDLEC